MVAKEPPPRKLTELEQLQADRKTLPIFHYREQLLEAVRDYQVRAVCSFVCT